MSRLPIPLVGTEGVPAFIVTESQASAEPLPSSLRGRVSAVVRRRVRLPVVLAGPILRRVDTGSARIWLMTSVPVQLSCVVRRTDTQELVGRGTTESIRLGDRLFLNVINVDAQMEEPSDQGPPVARSESFPPAVLLSYSIDAVLRNGRGVIDSGGNFLLRPETISYGGIGLPTFFIPQETSEALRIAHGSCRKLHGAGVDAVNRLDAHLAANARNLDLRPSALLLGGDQIYGDDVHPDIIPGVVHLAQLLLGWNETVPSGPTSVSSIGVNQRQPQAPRNRAPFLVPHGLTSHEMQNHLIGFGEFAAMYLLAWSPDIWNSLPELRRIAGGFASGQIRRVLANVPVYMIFDDHDVTDDWNLNRAWLDGLRTQTGRRIVANALAAFWAFQAIGNDHSGVDAPIRARVISYLGASTEAARNAAAPQFADALHSFHSWDFSVPNRPPIVFLDTRTRRRLERQGDPVVHPGLPADFVFHPGLMNDDALGSLARKLREFSRLPAPEPVVIVSPTPFIGYKRIEDLQRLLSRADVPRAEAAIQSLRNRATVAAFNPVAAGTLVDPLLAVFNALRANRAVPDPLPDPEAWSLNPATYARFLHALADSGRRRFVILSGDVHYGFTAVAMCSVRTGNGLRHIELVQLTASALKNEFGDLVFIQEWASRLRQLGGTLTELRALLDRLPPPMNAPSETERALREIVDIAASSLLFDDNVHSLIGSGTFAGPDYRLEEPGSVIPQNWDLRLRWRYLHADERNTLVTKNNVGLVNINPSSTTSTGSVEQTLLGEGGPWRTRATWSRLPLRPTPVIIVPGIMGTRLTHFATRSLVWNPAGLVSDPNGIVADTSMLVRLGEELVPDEGHQFLPMDPRASRARRIPHFYNLVGICYAKLAFALSEQLPVRFTTYACGYDWRQSNADSAIRLRSVVDEAKRDTGAEKVIIVAHSMGGLVSRYYCKELGGEANVAALFLLGSPSHGAPKAYRMLKQGIDWFEFPMSAILRLPSREESQQLNQSMPSLCELLPTAAYLRAHPDWLRLDGISVSSGRAPDDLYFHPVAGVIDSMDGGRRSPEAAQMVRQNITQAISFHQTLEEAGSDGGVYTHPNTFLVTSTSENTELGYDLEQRVLAGPGVGGFDVRLQNGREGPGDGTVPQFSAERIGHDGRIFRARGVAHDALANDDTVINHLLRNIPNLA